jgi:general secretion pathway protein E
METDLLATYEPSLRFLKAFSISYSRQHKILGLERTGDDCIWLALPSSSGWEQVDIVSRRLRCTVEPLWSDEDAIQQAINASYVARDARGPSVLDEMSATSLVDQIQKIASREDLLNNDSRAPIVKLVNQLLFDAVLAGASDIHIQPYEECVKVRQRIDGVLFDVVEIPKAIQEEVLTRIKVMGRMNIAEKRLPQDGRATVQLGDRTIDLRIASLPTNHNERIVIRLLDKSTKLFTLSELGMDAATMEKWRRLIRLDHGLILVTGPTGSGKSTTLYGVLQEIFSSETNILTLEDPIEYQIEGVSQTQVNEKKGMTFGSGMRSLLRQDPDIIMVGEIRDADTASMAMQASLTGHLVLSTLHTNDAASSVTRLLDLGVEPYLVASSLVASLAQRLVRTLCSTCKQPQDDGTAISRGCSVCRHSGYRGRVGIFELLIVSDSIRDQINRRENASTIRKTAMQEGMTLLFEDGKRKVQRGMTTLQEVLRVSNVATGEL